MCIPSMVLAALMWVMPPTSPSTSSSQADQAAGQASAGSQIATELAPPFGDHAVLQRDRPIAVWGRAAPGQTVTVALGGAVGQTTSSAAGEWKLTLPAMAAGGPFTLSVETGDGQSAEASDVLVGEVFLCSGQSNMAWPVASSDGAEGAIGASQDEAIRMLAIPHLHSPDPLTDYGVDVAWELPTPETVGSWSAVCYFAAHSLRQDTLAGVPIGMINASWGGSSIKAWLDEEALTEIGGFEKDLAILRLYTRDPGAAQQQFGAQWESWWKRVAGSAPWEPAAGASWPSAPEGLGDWTQWDGLARFTGMIWFRTEFDLTEEQASQDARLFLGAVDEVDQTWINGKVVGNTFGYGTERVYHVPASNLRPGRNVLVVNVLNTWASGGLTGDHSIRALALSAGSRVALPSWSFQPVQSDMPWPPRAPWESVAGLTGIHNAMVAPLREFGLRGVIWYQGESDAGEGIGYHPWMAGLIRQWRRQFQDSTLPAFVVQLPNYGPRPTTPVESGWAAVREAQRRATQSDPHAAVVVTLDLGNPLDIHPTNKRPVGERIARAMRHVIYGAPPSPSGAVPVRAAKEDNRVAVWFEGVTDSLVNFGGSGPVGFELCGPQPTGCRWADARVDGDRVLVQVEDDLPVERVRYAWSDDPVVTLFDGSGLPVGTFELPVAQ